jgi:hypothetical protein
VGGALLLYNERSWEMEDWRSGVAPSGFTAGNGAADYSSGASLREILDAFPKLAVDLRDFAAVR